MNRILLIYDHCRQEIVFGQTPRLAVLNASAGIIRSFVEDYHEKQEEDYLFPRFRKAGQLTDLVDTLLRQHNAGRRITDELLGLTKGTSLSPGETGRQAAFWDRSTACIARTKHARIRCCSRPSANWSPGTNMIRWARSSRTDEHKHFGQDGFETMVARVADIEKQLGDDYLNQFTPL